MAYENWKILGYTGQHEEAGATIVDEQNEIVLTTTHVKNGNWNKYYQIAQLAANAPALFNSLVDLLDVLEEQLTDDAKENESIIEAIQNCQLHISNIQK